MAVVSVPGNPSSVPGNTASAPAAVPSIWPSVAQQPMLSVLITNQANGIITEVTNTVLSVDISYGLDMSYSTATVQLTSDPLVSKYSIVQIFCSAGSLVPGQYPISTPNRSGVPLRFTGLYLRTQANLWPHTFSMICTGMLYMASQLRVPPALVPGTTTVIPTSLLSNAPIGILLFTNIHAQNPVVNGLLTGPGTDAQAIIAILALVANAAIAAGVPNGGSYFNQPSIQGTTAVFGTIVPLDFLWSPYQSAIDVINQFDQICLGFRTHDKYSGRIGRSQIFGYPSIAADANGTLTEGIDIWDESNGIRSVEQLCNASFVEGASIPSGGSGIINAYVQQSNPFQPNTLPVIDQFSSGWIEGSSLVVNQGLSANAVATWRLGERNREVVTGQWVTFRDDLFFPGHVITINAPHTAVTENVWIQRVDVRLTSDPISFTQTISGLGGGLPGYTSTNQTYTPPDPYQ